mmetsp:Transcript_43805/g.50386  ORF Transcript_43805/g.50386 Transcript_43805/m.50386 type:complete len:127 (-) Transcript_43805:396-776(-)
MASELCLSYLYNSSGAKQTKKKHYSGSTRELGVSNSGKEMQDIWVFFLLKALKSRGSYFSVMRKISLFKYVIATCELTDFEKTQQKKLRKFRTFRTFACVYIVDIREGNETLLLTSFRMILRFSRV